MYQIFLVKKLEKQHRKHYFYIRIKKIKTNFT